MWPTGTSLKEKSLLSCLPNNNNTLLRKPCASSTSAYGAPMTVLYLQCLIQDLYSSERKLKGTEIYSNIASTLCCLSNNPKMMHTTQLSSIMAGLAYKSKLLTFNVVLKKTFCYVLAKIELISSPYYFYGLCEKSWLKYICILTHLMCFRCNTRFVLTSADWFV